MRNWKLKLWSLLIACCVALFVNSQTNAGVVTFVVPVELQNLPPKKVVLFPTAGQAQIKLRGPSYLLSAIGASPPIFRIRVPENSGNRFVVRLSAEFLDLPPGIMVQAIEPPEIEFILDDVITKEVRVEVARIGQLAEHMTLEQVALKPATVKVSGPQTEIEGLRSLETSPLDLREITESTTRRLKVRNPGRFTKLSTEEIEVVITVSQQQTERKFASVPIEIRSTSDHGFTTNPATATVEVSGPVEIVSKLGKEEIVPYVKIENGMTENERRKVHVDLPAGVVLVFLEPETVALKRVEPTSTKGGQ